MAWWQDAGSTVANGLSGIVSGIVGSTAKTATDVVKAVDFVKDPAGYITSLLQQAVYTTSTKLIPPMIDALHPDYTAQWWIDSYRVSFGMAFLLAAVLLVVSFVQTQKGKNSGKELAESLFVALPGFVIAGAFGPLVGQLIGKVFVQLEDSIAAWAVGSSTKDYFKHLGDAAASKDAQELWGTALISQITLEALLIGMIVVVFVLLIQLATMYLTGALMALFLAWLVNPKTRHLAKIGPTVWLALCFSHALLILLVGIVFRAVGGLQMKAVEGDAGDFATFVNLALPAVLICMIIFAPMALLKIASPASAPLGGGGQARDGGLNSPSSAPQIPTGNGGRGGSSGPQNPNQAAGNGNQSGSGWTPSTQPVQSGGGGGGSTTINASNTGTTGSAANQAAQAGGRKSAQAAAQQGATSAASKTATAGTAASGVGAPVAVAAVLANAALKAAATAVRAGHQAAEQAGDAGTHD